MEHEAKSNVQPEREEYQKEQEPQVQSQISASHDLPDISQDGIRNLTREDVVALQQTIGNRAVVRILSQRQDGEDVVGSPIHREGEEDEQDYPGPRSSPLREDVLDYPGPRTKPSREEPGPQHCHPLLRQ